MYQRPPNNALCPRNDHVKAWMLDDMSSLTSIREAVPKEAALLSALALRSKAHWGYSPEFIRACETELTFRPSDLEGSNCEFFVAVNENKIAGFYCIRSLSSDKFELDALFVEPELIGSGIGRSLIQHAIQIVNQHNGRILLIQGDPHAENFYTAAGGKLIGTRESGSVPGRFLPLFEIDVR